MKFVVDAQLPPALADWLGVQGHEAKHIADLSDLQASDGAIWRLAREQRRIIVTKDRDFAIWAAERTVGPQVVWLRLGNATTRSLLTWLEPRWGAVETALAEGIHLIEVRP